MIKKKQSTRKLVDMFWNKSNIHIENLINEPGSYNNPILDPGVDNRKENKYYIFNSVTARRKNKPWEGVRICKKKKKRGKIKLVLNKIDETKIIKLKAKITNAQEQGERAFNNSDYKAEEEAVAIKIALQAELNALIGVIGVSKKKLNNINDELKLLKEILIKNNIIELDDYYKLTYNMVLESYTGNCLMKKYSNVLNMLDKLVPNIFNKLEITKFKLMPRGWWDNLSNQKNRLNNYLKKIGVTKIEDYYKIDKSKFNNEIGFIHKYNPSFAENNGGFFKLIETLQPNIYKQFHFHKFKYPPIKYFDNVENQKKAFKCMLADEQIIELKDYKKIDCKMLKKHNIYKFLKKYNGLHGKGGLLETLIPEIYKHLIPSSFEGILPNEYWKNIENQKNELNEMLKKEEIITLEDYEDKFKYDLFNKHNINTLIKIYNDSPRELLENLKPNVYNKINSKFKKKQGYWKNIENQKKELDKMLKHEGIITLEDYIKVGKDLFYKHNIYCLIKNKTYSELLENLKPDIYKNLLEKFIDKNKLDTKLNENYDGIKKIETILKKKGYQTKGKYKNNLCKDYYLLPFYQHTIINNILVLYNYNSRYSQKNDFKDNYVKDKFCLENKNNKFNYDNKIINGILLVNISYLDNIEHCIKKSIIYANKCKTGILYSNIKIYKKIYSKIIKLEINKFLNNKKKNANDLYKELLPDLEKAANQGKYIYIIHDKKIIKKVAKVFNILKKIWINKNKINKIELNINHIIFTF